MKRKHPLKLKPLSRAEYAVLAKITCPADLSYPKDHYGALLELRDRGFEPEIDFENVLHQCQKLGLIPNAYILRNHEIDLVAAYCEKNKMYGDDLIGCRYLGLDFKSYKKAEREMRNQGFDVNESLITAMPSGKGGRRVGMMPLRAKTKRRFYS